MATRTVAGAERDDGDVYAPARVSTEREAFDRFPYGLLVVERGGRVVCANRAAERLI